MGEAKRNKARLGDWYGKAIVPGHPDCPPPKPKPSYADPAPVLQNIVGAQHQPFLDGMDDRLQVDQTPRDEQTIEFLPAAENVEPRRQSSPAYRRVNRQFALSTMALLACALVGGSSTGDKS